MFFKRFSENGILRYFPLNDTATFATPFPVKFTGPAEEQELYFFLTEGKHGTATGG